MRKKINDEELQRIVFENMNQEEPVVYGDGDHYYYDILKGALSAKQGTGLSEDFARQVTKRAVQRKRLHVIFRMAISYMIAAILFSATAGIALFLLAEDILIFLLDEILAYKYPLAFGFLTFVLVQIVDELVGHTPHTS